MIQWQCMKCMIQWKCMKNVWCRNVLVIACIYLTRNNKKFETKFSNHPRPFISLLKYLPGWKQRHCRGGVGIPNPSENYLISLVDNEEECADLCNAMPECNLAVFDTSPVKRNGRCSLKKEFSGPCDHESHYFTKRFKGYFKYQSGKDFIIMCLCVLQYYILL